MSIIRKFKLLESDFRLFYGAYLQQKSIRFLLVALAMIALDLVYAGIVTGDYITPAVFVVLIAALVVWQKWTISKRTRLTMEQNTLAGETITVTLTDTMIRQRSHSGEVRARLEELHKVRSVTGLYIFYLTKDDVILLPKRTLKRADCAEIDKVLKEKVKSRESFWRRSWLPLCTGFFCVFAAAVTILTMAGLFDK